MTTRNPPTKGILGDLFSRVICRAEFNRARIGGSDAAAIMGLSDYSTPMGVYADKVDGVSKFTTHHMRMGKLFEYAIASECAERFWPEQDWLWVGFFAQTLDHPTRAWQRLSPDVLHATRPRVADAKRCSYLPGRHGEPGTDQVAAYELIQVTFYMEALRSLGYEAEAADLWVHDLSSDDFYTYTIPFDANLAGVILERCEKFYVDHILPQIPPPIDGSVASSQWLVKKHPDVVGPLRDPTPEEAELVRVLRAVEVQEKTLAKQSDHLRNILKKSIGDDAGLEVPDVGRLRWFEKRVTDKRGNYIGKTRELRAYWKKGG